MRQRMKRVMGVLLSLALAMGMMISSSQKASAYEDGPYESFVNTTTQVKFNGKSWTIIEDNSTAVDAGTVTLLAADERGFETCYFNTDENNKYSESLVKKFLDDVIAIGSFRDVADAIEDTENGKLYLLSVEEAEALPEEVRKIKFASGDCTNVSEWWLRTPGFSWKRAACVYGRSGSINSMGTTVDHSYGVRPALKLKLSAVTFDPSSNTFEYNEPMDGAYPKHTVEMHRLYNPNSGEHFYTGNLSEKDSLINEGWNYEGVAWNAPDFSLNPVYRLYDKNAGVHRYTMDEDKRDGFIAEGWSDEGIGWYSDEIETIPVFGLYNKNALQAGAYHFTADESERDSLIELGWTDEGIGWYGVTPAESEYVPGDTVILGSYEQDNDLSNGPEPIEWQVIGTRDGHTLLLSKYALESNKYNETYMEIDWENCTLRSWLNNDFYNTAFSASDRKRIVTAHNENPDSYELYKPWNKDSEVAGAVGGNATDDNVFLLSFEEVRDYLDGRLYNYKIGAENYNQKLLCRPTAYVKAQGVETYSNSDNIYPADTVGCCWWWLRSPGYAQDFAASVCDNGALSNRIVKYDADGVRPALLID